MELVYGFIGGLIVGGVAVFVYHKKAMDAITKVVEDVKKKA